MAETIWLVTKAPSAGQMVINGIHTMIINADDALSVNDILALAVAQARSAGHPVTDSYFDTADNIGDLISGPMGNPGDTVIIELRKNQSVGGP